MRAHENAQEPTTINATAIINARAINSYKAQKCDFLIEPECMCVYVNVQHPSQFTHTEHAPGSSWAHPTPKCGGCSTWQHPAPP